MATRETFLQELKNLNQEVITMSQMVQDAIDSSFQALSEHNTELADKIIKGDRDVDNMERKIETHCLMLMLKQQPVASDLRHISTGTEGSDRSGADGRSGSGYCRSVPALRGSGLRSCEQTPSGDGGKCKNDG